MSRAISVVSLTGVLLLGACAVQPPPGPSVMALPPSGKPLAQFQQDDAYCRQYASQTSGGAASAQAATNNAVGNAVVGTGIGAAAGALLGAAAGNAGAGAAIGAGTGLLVGSASGVNSANASAGSLQRGYDISYTQCMTAQGNTVQQAQAPAPYYYPGYYGPYAPYPVAYGSGYYGPGYYGPGVVIGVEGWRRHW
jgi:hypothetical protein